ncbi:dicarboxylate/amino acid:cation symporter, partial [bacterium]
MRLKLHWQILIALVVGVAAGLLLPAGLAVYDFLGTTFLRALKMVIVPLITGSIISGVAGVGAARGLGRLFSKTFGWYVATSLLAIVMGMVLVNIIQPGLRDGEPVGETLGLTAAPAELQEQVAGKGAGDLVNIIQRMIPENPVAAAAEGQMLPLIFFCVILGLAVTSLPARQHASLLGFFEALFGAMMKITHWVIATAPLGIFGLMAKIVVSAGFDAFVPLLRYGGTVL